MELPADTPELSGSGRKVFCGGCGNPRMRRFVSLISKPLDTAVNVVADYV